MATVDNFDAICRRVMRRCVVDQHAITFFFTDGRLKTFEVAGTCCVVDWKPSCVDGATIRDILAAVGKNRDGVIDDNVQFIN